MQVISLGKLSHKITADDADILVARGQADRIPGLNQIRMRSIRPRGEAREWRKRPCRSMDGSVTMTMQLVPVGKDTKRQSITPTRHRSNAKRKPSLGKSNSCLPEV